MLLYINGFFAKKVLKIIFFSTFLNILKHSSFYFSSLNFLYILKIISSSSFFFQQSGNTIQNHHHHQQLTSAPPPPVLPPPPVVVPPQPHGGGGAGSIRPGSMADRARMANIPMPETALKCPRCDSTNTKFCYFNNYSLSQPRHFCKACKR